MCGEKSNCHTAVMQPGGSPPRVRGKVNKLNEGLTDERITPACAGKSFTLELVEQQDRDHPRVCGEKNVRPSSNLRFKRITPACAGKSCN